MILRVIMGDHEYRRQYSLATMKHVVKMILKLKHGKHFGGHLESADSVWAIEDNSRTIINVLVILKFKSNTENITDQIKDIIFHKIFQNSEDFPKLTSIRRRYLGFTYLFKDQLTVDDCVSTLQTENYKKLNQMALQDIISKCCNLPLPRENSALWEILVSPISLEEKNGNYPVLLRFSHIAGDGLSFTNLMLKTFSHDAVADISFEKVHIKNPHEDLVPETTNVFSKTIFATKTVLNVLYLISIAPSVIINQHFMRKNDQNSLHGPELSGEKNLVYAVEDESKLIALVKHVKQSIPGSKFSDILFAAISASLNKHFTKNSQLVPKFVSAVVPALLSPPNMDEKPKLQNQFSVGILDLPIQIDSNSMLQRLRKVMRWSNSFRKSPQYQINYWLIKYLCGSIPQPILEPSLKTDQLTMTISNVPGVPKVTIMDDCHIEDIIFFTHHRGKTGVGFSILTYDNRFQLSLAIDKSILASRNEAQMLVDDVFKYIKKLHEEVHKHNVSIGQ